MKRPEADPAAMLREEAQRRAQSRLPAPRLARNVAPGQTVDLDFSPRMMAGGGSGDVNKVRGRVEMIRDEWWEEIGVMSR